MKPCVVCGEKGAAHVGGKPYCNRHYQSMIKYGHPYGKKRRSTNKFETIGDVLVITTKKGEVFLADAEDEEKLKRYSWCATKKGYAVANINHKVTKMHRYIMGINDETVLVDHKNNDRCDNRKRNLRVCTYADNARNKTVSKNSKSGYIGIRISEYGKFHVRISFDRTEVHIGSYETIEEAIAARIEAEKKYHGEFGSNNN